MEEFIISVANKRTETRWKNIRITWEKLVERLKNTTRTGETQAEYNNFSKARQDDIKDVGGFVGGCCKNGQRRANTIEYRSLLTLDADFAEKDFCDQLELFFDSTYLIYSTHKHTKEKPRLRLVVPLSRNCTPEEYEAIARQVAYDIGIDQFDDTTYQAHRLMYYPSTSQDGEYVFMEHKKEPLNVEKILAKYEDWKDVTQWRQSSRTVKKRSSNVKKQENPIEKKGIVGAFCRTYDIENAIATFLPDKYEECAVPNRYTYKLGSTSAGAVVYQDGLFLYSNHATDPTSGLLCNAFDLVRIHKFAHLDEEAKEGTPTISLPSYKAMMEFATKDDAVKLLLHKERLQGAAEDFEGIEEKGEKDDHWALQLAVDNKGRVISTIDNVKKILEHDENVKGKIKYNAFTSKVEAHGAFLWCKDQQKRDWTDNDDAGLRHYLEKTYEIKGRNNIEDAWMLVANENSYHPIKDYLNGIVWDGKPRLETLFIDYMGAENSTYVREITKKHFVAGVARIFVPGIKYDTMLVLVGLQGCGKSQIIKKLGLNWFSDTLFTMQGKDAYEQLQGFWIIEIAELAAMKKMEVEAIKHFMSKSEDAYRAAYGRHVENRKRQCIFFGTTNKFEFLKDMTGNRRFLPIDVDTKKASKDIWKDLTEDEINQVWAEAVTYYKKGEALYLEGDVKEMAEQVQNRHLEESPLTGDILNYLDKKLPEKWNDYDLSARRAYFHGGDFGKQEEGTVERTKVCPIEIWCELFQGDKKDFTPARSKEIKDVILKTGEWERETKKLRFGKLYGVQRGFIRIENEENIPLF